MTIYNYIDSSTINEAIITGRIEKPRRRSGPSHSPKEDAATSYVRVWPLPTHDAHTHHQIRALLLPGSAGPQHTLRECKVNLPGFQTRKPDNLEPLQPLGTLRQLQHDDAVLNQLATGAGQATPRWIPEDRPVYPLPKDQGLLAQFRRVHTRAYSERPTRNWVWRYAKLVAIACSDACRSKPLGTRAVEGD